MTSRLADRVLAGDPRAVARAISLIEDEDPASVALLRDVFSRTGRAYVIGVTGPPGAGKSTLVDRLVTELRRGAAPPFSREGSAEHGPTVGVIAVDPTSPFSGGAVLGDRLRMQTHANDEGVFIRSMATRGHLGGLARATEDAVLVLDAAGSQIVVIETVGVGQDEVDIVRTADVSIVVLVPGAGDDVQALKAGIMEIADVFVVNKSDRAGADGVVAAVETVLALRNYGPDEWRPPIVRTVATDGTGTEEVLGAVSRFRAHSEAISAAAIGSGAARRRARIDFRLRDIIARRLMNHLERDVLASGELDAIVNRIEHREVDPYSAADELIIRALAPIKR